MLFYSFVRVLLLLLLAPAALADTFPSSNDRDYFPLTLGSTWTYKDQAGAQAEVEVSECKTIGSEKIYVLKCKEEHGIFPGTYRVDKKGIHLVELSEANITIDKPMTLLAFPLRSGATWTQEIQLADTKHNFSISLSSKNKVEGRTTITVPAGTFRCVTIKFEYQIDAFGQKKTITMDNYYAAGVGPVKSIVHEPGVPDKTAELTDFKRGK